MVEPVGVQNKDVGSASQTLPTGIRLLECRLEKEGQTEMNYSSQSIHNGYSCKQAALKVWLV